MIKRVYEAGRHAIVWAVQQWLPHIQEAEDQINCSAHRLGSKPYESSKGLEDSWRTLVVSLCWKPKETGFDISEWILQWW